jgi:hypothetical protein
MLAPELLTAAGPSKWLIADKAYDTNHLRNLPAQMDIDPIIPSVVGRKPLVPHNRSRNIVNPLAKVL